MLRDHLKYDVLILGAGVAGCATAIALKNENPKLGIAIIEREPFSVSKLHIGETLPPQASRQLQQLGLWNEFIACDFVSSFGTSAAWGSASLHTNEFLYSAFGYGWNLDRSVFDKMMTDAAIKKGIEILSETSCYETVKTNYGFDLHCVSGQNSFSMAAKFLVDATGRKAAFASMQGAEKISHDQLVGIYSFYDTSNNSIAGIGKGTMVETDASGWWYTATLPNNKLVLAYMTDADIANHMQLRKPNELDQLLCKTNHTRQRIQHATAISQPRVVAAHTQSLTSVAGNGWLAVGDAASCYDPVSSLGIFKSLAMSRYAAFAILNYLDDNGSGLQKYQQIISNEFQAYQAKKQDYYNQETRFSNQSFWKRRQSIKQTSNINQNSKHETQFFI